TVEDGAKVFVEKGFQEPANAYEEARRGAYNPTYLYYTLGKLQIQELRDQYRKAKNATLRQFHDAFVSQGAIPIALVRRILLQCRRSRGSVPSRRSTARSSRCRLSPARGTSRRRCSGLERVSISRESTGSGRSSTPSSPIIAAAWERTRSTARCW